MGMRQGQMTVHRLVRALLGQGMTDAVLDLLTNSGQPGWARLLERGATFTWEAWDLVDGTDYSQSHAWSASVIQEILEHLLGVRNVTPGELLIAPPLCRLDHARGRVPAGNGWADVSWRRHGPLVEVECTVPPGVLATVRLPAGPYEVKGPTPDGPAPRSLPEGAASTAGTTREFRVHTGTWTFAPE